jgi:hypothetical protein
MATVANSPSQVKPGRTVRVEVKPSEVNPAAIIVIREPKHSDHYMVWPLPADFGRAFKVEQFLALESPTYHVLLAPDGRHSCQCDGFCHEGHCEHVSSLLALCQAGQL